VLRGEVRVDDSTTVGAAEVALFGQTGNCVRIDSVGEAMALLLSGEPIDEPIAGMGPFVMNTQQEIYQAIADYQSGKMGRLA
jgi:redox-sensitive bicupin YhaK (pirin superfamily)